MVAQGVGADRADLIGTHPYVPGATLEAAKRVTCENSPFSSIPHRPGTYALIMRLVSSTEMQVGKLGAFHCPAGWYTYVGSALGPGGLMARLARHRQRHKRLHWHIDYLLPVVELTEIWWMASSDRWECVWAQALGRVPGASVCLPGFGSSDCRCSTHLLYFVHRPSAFNFTSQLEGQTALYRTILAQHF